MCVTNLMNYYPRVEDIPQERDGWADCVDLDLKKALDKVPHRKLLWKLENTGGLKGRTKEWMRCYFTSIAPFTHPNFQTRLLIFTSE